MSKNTAQSNASPSTNVEANTVVPSMACEILAVGTELLLGDVVNTNASWLGKAMAELGLDVYWHATVGDNPKRLTNSLMDAMARSNVIVMTGGLGPTDDDLTVATLAKALDAEMVSDSTSEERIRAFYITRDTPMNKHSLKQALRPKSGIALANSKGTAPGLLWDVTDRVKALVASGELTLQKTDPTTVLVAMPGVPREMKPMWLDEAVPNLLPLLPGFVGDEANGNTGAMRLYTKFLKFFGIGESVIAAELKELLASASPTVSPYVGLAEVKLRLAVKANSQAEANAAFAPLERTILDRFGQYYTGADDETLESTVGQLLTQHHLTIAVAESCTGGLVSKRLTDISGSSAYVGLNMVTYSNDAKASDLGVPTALLEQHGAVSSPVAAAMAERIRIKAHADIGLSLTGIAGPTGGSADKPVGLVFIGLSAPGLLTDESMAPNGTIVRRVVVNAAYGRLDIRHWFSQYALNFTRQCMQGQFDLLNAAQHSCA